MAFRIPENSIEETGFEITRPGTLLVLLMLCLNWNDWKSTFKPVGELEADAFEDLQSEDENYFWTIVSSDCVFINSGISNYDSAGWSTQGFIKTQVSWATTAWTPKWTPPYLDEEVSTADIGAFMPQRTVYVGCELCDADQRADGECEHWYGGFGSWVSVDFDLPEESVVVEFLESVVASGEDDDLVDIAKSLLLQYLPTGDGNSKKENRGDL